MSDSYVITKEDFASLVDQYRRIEQEVDRWKGERSYWAFCESWTMVDAASRGLSDALAKRSAISTMLANVGLMAKVHAEIDRLVAAEAAPTLEIGHTQRGFAIAEFADTNGANCTIQKSSIATEDRIWLGVHDGRRMHLNRDQVKALIPMLQRFVETGSLEEGDE